MAILGTTTLTGCTSIPDFISGGSIMIFHQSSSPSSWTKLVDFNDRCIRVVSGTASSGGSLAFTSTLTTRSISSSVSPRTLTTAEMPSHAHSINASGAEGTPNLRNATPATGNISFDGSTYVFQSASVTAISSGGSAHTHPLASISTDSDFRVLYIDVICASKD
jgi:hypothetical protein